jgi:murein DD-endopeptidase MepM/ murein hydrolase activator NlpD
MAFLIGNMVGQHGWQAFWKSVWGQEVEMEIVFTGTVAPLAQVPNPDLWGGNRDEHTFSDVPDELLVPLPRRPKSADCENTEPADRRIFSVQYNGDYESGGEGCGSHPAEDILALKGTPVVSVMNGIVERVERRTWGFGNTVVVRHPNVPDPDYPEMTTTLHSSYGHLGRILVEEGMIVQKGEQIALTGQTGFATAPHLHFQIDRDEAPFHPYWPFTTTEATKAGLSFVDAVNEGLGKERAEKYTINPIAYTESYNDKSKQWDGTLITEDSPEEHVKEVAMESPKLDAGEVVPITPMRIWEVMVARMQERREARLARRNEEEMRPLMEEVQEVVVVEVEDEDPEEIPAAESYSADSGEAGDETPEDSVEEEVLSTAPTDIPMPNIGGNVVSVSMLHDGDFDREWEEIVLFARDEEGNFVKDVHFEGTIYIETSFGEAEFSPSALTEEQFDERGRAFIKMLPRGTKTIIPSVRGVFIVDGEPMVNARVVTTGASQSKGG